jgi:hypothetical protein
MKVKIFEARQQGFAPVAEALEQQMNEWLLEHTGLFIVDVRTTVLPGPPNVTGEDAAPVMLCMVFYDHRSKQDGDRRAGFLGFTG